MSIKIKPIKVLLYGNVFRDYRSQALVKILLDSGHHISLVCPDFYSTKIKLFSGLRLLYLVELLIKAPFADAIYLPPMNSRFIRSACWAARVFNKQLIVEMYISIYDTFVKDRKLLKGKQINPESRQAQEMFARDILSLKESDYLIHTAAHELDYWEKIFKTKVAKEKVFIAPNFNTYSLDYKKSEHQNGTLNICWWGTFIPLHGLENILEAMKILKANKIDFRCNLFGTDNDLFYVYEKKIKLERLDDCISLRKDLRFADNSLPQYLIDNCDLALGIFGNTDKAYNTVPNKLIEALSMKIPTLTMESIALKEFFEPDDLWTCQPKPDAIAQSIQSIAKGSAASVDWEKTRLKVLDTFSINRYQEVVAKVLTSASNDF
ncbi:MAG: glycosyltransferase family 1 protein [Cyanobacteria bacterium P01_G01_bin.19]